jgi:hypothetical protein
MVFWKGGKISTKDQSVFCEGERLALVNSFRYLGVTLQRSSVVYMHHVKERALLAIVAMNDIKEPSCISLETAMKLFKWKITPVISYGLDMMWHHLREKNLDTIEKLKAMFFKKVLCLSRYTSLCLVYILTRESFFIEDL